MDAMYERVTHDVRVTVTPEFQSDRSEPDENRWFWSYTIEITNLGEAPVRLRARRWLITDAHGRRQALVVHLRIPAQRRQHPASIFDPKGDGFEQLLDREIKMRIGIPDGDRRSMLVDMVLHAGSSQGSDNLIVQNGGC